MNVLHSNVFSDSSENSAELIVKQAELSFPIDWSMENIQDKAVAKKFMTDAMSKK